jgi:hypothetical protein
MVLLLEESPSQFESCLLSEQRIQTCGQ